ncbi:AT-rich interactive domain-containing protein 4B-like [Asterias rubens]|uniref:AT-rich interactive domain-containing protein 4B-like n=1 Tax=Asterias rubens TaxID=7604 RepID=UPI0014554CF8|nr:AT-rich interactive domain-containing protein 4B-like [Asterias rubens]
MASGEEPAYLTVGTDVSAKYRGAFCEAKVKIVKKFVKCKVHFSDGTNGVIPDELVKGNLKVGQPVEAKHLETENWTKGTIMKLTDASTYTVVFDDGDEKTLRRTSLCLQGERHFNESETLDHLPLTDPENFGTPVMRENKNKRKRRLSTRSRGDGDDDEDDDDDDSDDDSSTGRKSKKDDRDDSIGKVIVVETNDKRKNQWFPALVVDPTTAKDIQPKSKDHVVARSFKDNRYYSIDKQSRRAFASKDHNYKGDLSTLKIAVEKAVNFVETGQLPSNWDPDMLKKNRGNSGNKKNKNDAEKADAEEEEEESEDDTDDEYDEEKDAWLASLHKFMEERGTPINKPPVLGFRDLNLYKLYKLVQDIGGCRKVTDKQKWRHVSTKMGIPSVTTAQPYNIKAAYNKYLYAFEEYNRKLGPGITRSLPRTRRRSSYSERWPMTISPKVEKSPSPKELRKMEESESEEEVSPRNKKKGNKKTETKAEKETPDKKDSKAKEKERREEEKKQREKREKERLEKEKKDKAEEEKKEKAKQEKERLEREKKEKAEKEKEALRDKKERERKEREEKEKELENLRQKRQKEKEKEARRRRDPRTLEGPGSKADKEEEEDSGTEQPELKQEHDPSIQADFDIGEKIKVQYGRGRTQKIYEAKIVDYEVEDGQVVYTIHYMGWNVRFDEVITADRILGWAEKKRERQQKDREKERKEKEMEAERERKEKEKEEKEREKREKAKLELEKAKEKEQKEKERKEKEKKEKEKRDRELKEERERKEKEEREKAEQESKRKKAEKEAEKERELKKLAEEKSEKEKTPGKISGKRGRPSITKTPTPSPVAGVSTVGVTPSTPGRSTSPQEQSSSSKSPTPSRSYATRVMRSDRKSLSDSPFASGLPAKPRPRRSSGHSESVTRGSDSESEDVEDNSSQDSISNLPETKDDKESPAVEEKTVEDTRSAEAQPELILEKLTEENLALKVVKEAEAVIEKEDVVEPPKDVEDLKDIPAEKEEEVKEEETKKKDKVVEVEEIKPPSEKKQDGLIPQEEPIAQPVETPKKKDKKEKKKETKSKSKKESKAKKDQSRQSSGDAKKETKGKKETNKKSSQAKAEAAKEKVKEQEKEKKEKEVKEETVNLKPEPEEDTKKRKGRKRASRKSLDGKAKNKEESAKDDTTSEPEEKKRKEADPKHDKKAAMDSETKQDKSAKDGKMETESFESSRPLPAEPSSSSVLGKPFAFNKNRPLLSTPPTSPENSPAQPSSPASNDAAKGSHHEADDEHVSGKSDSDAMIEVASIGESSHAQRRQSPHHDTSSSNSSADIHMPTPTTSTDIRTVKHDVAAETPSPKKRRRNTSESESSHKRSRKRNRRQTSVASAVAERRRSAAREAPRHSSSDTDETQSDLKHHHSSHKSEKRESEKKTSEVSHSSHHRVEGPPIPRKWNFLIDVSHITDPEERISLIQRQLNDLRKIYMQLKTEVATIDRRRKKFRRKEREAAQALASQKQPEKKSVDST